MNSQNGDNVYGTYFLFISNRNSQIVDLSYSSKGMKDPPITQPKTSDVSLTLACDN